MNKVSTRAATTEAGQKHAKTNELTDDARCAAEIPKEVADGDTVVVTDVGEATVEDTEVVTDGGEATVEVADGVRRSAYRIKTQAW